MRFILTSVLFFLALPVFASERNFECLATDSHDYESDLKFNIDTGEIERRDSGDDGASWEAVYSKQIGCSNTLPKTVNCTHRIQHNFDDAKAPFPMASDHIRCADGSGSPMVKFDGDLEINFYGDGKGRLACGKFTKYKLVKCQVTTN